MGYVIEFIFAYIEHCWYKYAPMLWEVIKL